MLDCYLRLQSHVQVCLLFQQTLWCKVFFTNQINGAGRARVALRHSRMVLASTSEAHSLSAPNSWSCTFG